MANTSNRTPTPVTLIVAMSASASGHDNIAGLATTEKTTLHNPASLPEKEKNNVVRTISPPLALVATTEHVSVSRNGDEPQEEHLADWLATQRSRRGTISHKTVKKRCRDNQSRGRPRMNPSALAPACDPQDLVHSNWSVPLPVKETSTQQSRGRHRHAPWVSHHSVPSWLRPTNLAYVCVSRLYETHPWRAASFGLPNVVCRSSRVSIHGR